MNKLLPLALAALAASPALAEISEQDVMIEGSAHPIPATITLPGGDGPFPIVLMFHGTGSDRHEAGMGYDIFAPRLAEAGIASLRFDFAGNGDSPVDYAEYTPSGGLADGLEALAYAASLPQVDAGRLGVMGWSQGGYVALLAAARTPEVQSVVTWAGLTDMSGSFAEGRAAAEETGIYELTFDWREPLNLSIDWFTDVESIDLGTELTGYTGPLLAINGAEDTVVPPATVETILAATGSEVKEGALIEGGDHTFNIFSGDMAVFDELSRLTIEWFEETL
ncbi:alpha/beta hydrolase family protein [Pseudoroseicyclus sp. CXY001]|uniref:alpha/beta hydrolase family protein n=1 Tax=Pseudoroseicyclus sp. CXY001 TaxID=3242492 RepID=UPI0035715585